MLVVILLLITIVSAQTDVYVLVDGGTYILTPYFIDLFDLHQIKALFLYNVTFGDIVYHQIMLSNHFIITLQQFMDNTNDNTISFVITGVDSSNLIDALKFTNDELNKFKQAGYRFPLWSN